MIYIYICIWFECFFWEIIRLTSFRLSLTVSILDGNFRDIVLNSHLIELDHPPYEYS